MAKLTQKEKMLLSDQKNHEQICIEKYQSYAAQAQDDQLKQLFNSFAQAEQTHLNTLSQIMSGQVPNMNQSQQGGQNQQSSMQSSTQSSSQGSAQSSTQSSTESSSQSSAQGSTQELTQSDRQVFGAQGSAQNSTQSSGMQNQGQTTNDYSKHDATLLNDMLMTEKYVSGAYNTAIFEFTDANVRQALNHIQKEEQEHGEKIFNYMQSHGMYNVQQ